MSDSGLISVDSGLISGRTSGPCRLECGVCRCVVVENTVGSRDGGLCLKLCMGDTKGIKSVISTQILLKCTVLWPTYRLYQVMVLHLTAVCHSNRWQRYLSTLSDAASCPTRNRNSVKTVPRTQVPATLYVTRCNLGETQADFIPWYRTALLTFYLLLGLVRSDTRIIEGRLAQHGTKILRYYNTE